MNLNLNRLEETLFLFSTILPLGNLEKQVKLQKSLNMNMTIDNTLAILMQAIHTMMKQNPEEALGYLDFIRQGINYIFEERAFLPEVDNSDEAMRAMKIWKVQHG